MHTHILFTSRHMDWYSAINFNTFNTLCFQFVDKYYLFWIVEIFLKMHKIRCETNVTTFTLKKIEQTNSIHTHFVELFTTHTTFFSDKQLFFSDKQFIITIHNTISNMFCPRRIQTIYYDAKQVSCWNLTSIQSTSKCELHNRDGHRILW